MSNVNIDEDDNDIFVTIPYDEDAKEALKEQFGARWDPSEKHWRIRKVQQNREVDVLDVEKELKLHFPRDFR